MNNICQCNGHPCDHGVLERPRYFPRQLITPVELTLEQQYFRDKLRRHNRYLHGWGVVCGAMVCPILRNACDAEPWKVTVTPGYLLGPHGDEIVIENERQVDLRTSGVEVMPGDPPGELADPWCTPVYRPVRLDEPTELYVAVQYKEYQTRPVRVQPVGCGCDDTQCELSRLCDGYQIGVFTECPPSHQDPPLTCGDDSQPQLPADLFCGPAPNYPPCPTSPWVFLAKVTVDPSGQITEIDNCSCRRLVLSLANFWWQCASEVAVSRVLIYEQSASSDAPYQAKPGDRLSIRVQGTGFRSSAKVNLGSGVRIDTNTIVVQESTYPGAPAAVSFDAEVLSDALDGPRTLTIANPDCTTAVYADVIYVKRESDTSPTPSTVQPSRGARRASRRTAAS